MLLSIASLNLCLNTADVHAMCPCLLLQVNLIGRQVPSTWLLSGTWSWDSSQDALTLKLHTQNWIALLGVVSDQLASQASRREAVLGQALVCSALCLAPVLACM